MNKYPHLFSPIRIGKLTMKNRIFAAPASQPDLNQGVYLKKENICYYEARAKGGAAVVNLGDTVVHTRTGRAHPHKPLMDDPRVIPSLSDAARAIRQHGAFPCLLLSHCGKYANVDNLVAKSLVNEKPYGPIEEINPNGVKIYEMPKELIMEIVEAFGNAAKEAKRCGFEMIMIHGAHGWLLHQFMAPSNTRTDEFGGSFENRMRLTHLVLDAVRAAVGPGFPIEFRMSGEEGVPGGYDVNYAVRIAQSIESKIDLLHVSAGIHDVPEAFVVTHPDMFHPGRNVHLAAEIKKHVSVPVATIGGLSYPEELEEIIASGKADVVELSRALMADPDLPKKAHMGREDEIVHCMRCFACMTNIPTTRNMRCALNPAIGRELELRNLPQKAPVSKLVMVAGGGPAGMKAAITAADRGHKVILCESTGSLGGQINCEIHVPFKKNFVEFRNLLIREVEKRKDSIEVRLNTKATAALAQEISPDAIIIAVGAGFLVPPIPGIDDSRVVFADELAKDKPEIGDNVVIIGGGLIGCETAVHLAKEGKKVTVLEMMDDYASDAPIFHKIALNIQLRETGVTLYTNTRAKEIIKEGVVSVTGDGPEKTLPADTILCAAGMSSRLDVVAELLNAAPETCPVGNCIRPGQVFWAVSGGYFAALDL